MITNLKPSLSPKITWFKHALQCTRDEDKNFNISASLKLRKTRQLVRHRIHEIFLWKFNKKNGKVRITLHIVVHTPKVNRSAKADKQDTPGCRSCLIVCIFQLLRFHVFSFLELFFLISLGFARQWRTPGSSTIDLNILRDIGGAFFRYHWNLKQTRRNFSTLPDIPNPYCLAVKQKPQSRFKQR